MLAAALNSADVRSGDSAVVFSADLRSRVDEIYDAALDHLSVESLALLGRYRGGVTRSLLSSAPESSRSIEKVNEAIAGLLTARQPVPMQLAAIETLARTRDRQVAKLLLDRYATVSPQSQSAILDQLLSRPSWASKLVEQLESGVLRPSVLSAQRCAKLLAHADPSLRARAAEVLGMRGSPNRTAVVQSYRRALDLTGVVDRGREHFRKHCAACHQLEGHGHIVGPDLSGLTNRDPQWLLIAMLDPNRDVDARYVTWSVLADDGSLCSGLVIEETASMIRLREAGGKEHQLLRDSIEQFRASNASLMPEGLEKELTPQDVCDLIAYLSQAIGPPQSAGRAVTLPRYPPQIAPFLLDDSQLTEVRQQVIDQRPGMGPAIVALLIKDLNSGDAEQQNRQLTWIWRVALAVGRRNDGGEIRDLLAQSLANEHDPLQPWQAVVIGGGIINGLTQVGSWPNRRVAEILGEPPHHSARVGNEHSGSPLPCPMPPKCPWEFATTRCESLPSRSRPSRFHS